MGKAILRRIYGDFSTPTQDWTADIMAKHAIIPHQQFAYTIGKNSSDIAMVIDAMDILHSGRFDGFVLISSDSDFTRLASRIREQGIEVYGIGERKTPQAFVAACNRFIYVENISVVNEPQDQKSDYPVTKQDPTINQDAVTNQDPVAKQEPVTKQGTVTKQAQNHVFQLISNVMKNTNDPDGWANLSTIGQQLRNIYPDFDPRTYGKAKLSTLMRSIDRFEENPKTGYFRIKNNAT